MKYLAIILSLLPVLQSLGAVVLRSDPKTLDVPAPKNGESVNDYCQRALGARTCVDNDASPYVMECQDAQTVKEANDMVKNILDTADLRCKEFVSTLLDSPFDEDKGVGNELKSKFSLSLA